MFVSIVGERGKRFDFLEGVEPHGNERGIFSAPGFDGHGDLGGPEQRRADDADEEVVARIEKFHETAQTADSSGGGLSGGGTDGGGKCLQPG